MMFTTMTAVISDKAGNKTEKKIMFSVNRFGSNYSSQIQQKESLMRYILIQQKTLLLQKPMSIHWYLTEFLQSG